MTAFDQIARCSLNQWLALPENQKRWQVTALTFGTPVGRVVGPNVILWWVTDNHGHPMALMSIKGDDWMAA